MTDLPLLTREETLRGLYGPRASGLLYAIQSRVAFRALQVRLRVLPFLTRELASERELAYLEAFALGREPDPPPSIQLIESFAPDWAVLAPEIPAMRAAVAYLLSQRYRFAREAVPQVRAALTLDDEAVQAAFERQYQRPIDSIYTPAQTMGERLRWAWQAISNRLENLPPFWMIFALTVTEMVGASILALPIAVAGVGPLPAAIILIVLGLVNVLTIAAMAESVTRSGTLRYAGGYLGRIVSEYLGSAGSAVLTIGSFLLLFLALQAFYVGLATTLASVTGIHPAIWVAALFAVGVYFVVRDSLTSTAASAMVIAAINISLILILSVLALLHADPANLTYANLPFTGGSRFDVSILQLIFGIVLASYFGHLSMSYAAQTVLSRDPSGKSVVDGGVAASLVVIGLYVVWVIAVGAAVQPQVLAQVHGTALEPLTGVIGPAASALGLIFAVLGLGMGSLHMTIGLVSLVRERLPKVSHPVLLLPRRRGRLLLRPRGLGRAPFQLELTYLGLRDGSIPHFHLDTVANSGQQRSEIAIDGRWEWTPPEGLAGQPFLAIEIEAATPESACIRVLSSLKGAYEGEMDTSGLHLADIQSLPEDARQIVTWLMRHPQEVTASQVAEGVGQPPADVEALLGELSALGYLSVLTNGHEPRYRTFLAARRPSHLPDSVWESLEPDGSQEPAEQRAGERRGANLWASLGKPGRALIGLLPVILAFGLTEWAILSGRESFAGPINLVGAIIVPLLGGIFPILMLTASRRTGDLIPGRVWRFLGHPVTVGTICALFLASLFLHGLVIWTNPIERALAVGVGALMLLLIVWVARQRTFAPQTVVTLRALPGGEAAELELVDAGAPVLATTRITRISGEEERLPESSLVRLPGMGDLRKIDIALPQTRTRRLKLWSFQIADDGTAIPMQAAAELHGGDHADRVIVLGDAALSASVLLDAEVRSITITVGGDD